MRRALAAVALALALVGCDKPPEQGTVTGKEYHAAYSWVQMICAGYNKYGTCVTYIPVTHHVAERWELCLRSGEKTGCRDVDQITWHQYKIGDYYKTEGSS